MPHTVSTGSTENTITTMDIDETLATSLEKLKKLAEGIDAQLPIKRYVQNEISALLDVEAPLKEFFIKTFKTFGKCELSGSVVEGAMTARIFQVNKDLEIEIDIMRNEFTIPQELSHLLEPVTDKPGFVRLPFCLLPADRIGDYIDDAKRFLGCHENEQYSLEQLQLYISPLVIKDTFEYVYDHLPLSDLFNFVHDLFGMDSEFFPDRKMNHSLTETTAAVEMEIVSQEDVARGVLQHVLSADFVPAVHLSFWPPQASDWVSRYRVWPPHDTIQSIVDEGCQVVPRTSPGGDVHSEWRLSFSRPEATLAKLRSKEQQETYYFFKVFFYRYLKCVESCETGKPLYSYIIKTTMLWACEELHPEDKIWASLEHSVQMLLFKLLGSLEVGFLSHYFLPEINLLERVGQDVRKHCLAVISRWISNVLMTAPFDLPEKRGIMNFFNIVSTMAGTVIADGAFKEYLEEYLKKL